MRNLIDILEKNRDLKNIISDLKLNQLIFNNWSNFFGKLSPNFRFSYFKKGIIYVEANNYMWITEIEYYKKDILERINNYLAQKKKVYDINITYNPNFGEVKKSAWAKKKNKHRAKQTLLEKIKSENQKKLANGYTYCETCGKVLVPSGQCFLCK